MVNYVTFHVAASDGEAGFLFPVGSSYCLLTLLQHTYKAVAYHCLSSPICRNWHFSCFMPATRLLTSLLGLTFGGFLLRLPFPQLRPLP